MTFPGCLLVLQEISCRPSYEGEYLFKNAKSSASEFKAADSAFGEYISSYTAGVVSSASAVRVVLTNDAIVKMSRAGLEDGIVLQTVRSQPGEYKTGPDDLVALKDAGVSQAVISAMLAKNSGMETHPVVPVEVTPLSVNSDDPGVYFKNAQGQWELVGPELTGRPLFLLPALHPHISARLGRRHLPMRPC